MIANRQAQDVSISPRDTPLTLLLKILKNLETKLAQPQSSQQLGAVAATQ